MIIQQDNKVDAYWRVSGIDDPDYYLITWSIDIFHLQSKNPDGTWLAPAVVRIPFAFTFPTGT